MKDQEYEDAVKAVVDAANKADKARELFKESNAFAQDRLDVIGNKIFWFNFRAFS
ncbi:MAG: hypothetical protein WKF84_10365 [Pyrinomonadaceae bacterium]